MSQSLIGESESMRKVRAVIERAAPTDASILIWGETGVGREFTAEKIHEASHRANGPWLTVNWGAQPVFMEHPLLFGSAEHGPGLLERASGGTLLMDEITELQRENQAKLLRVLESGRFRPPGADHEVVLDVRLISTTWNPEQAVAKGALLPELYGRLGEVSLELPPLRWRREDMRALAERFLEDAWNSWRFAHLPIPRLTDDAVRKLETHPWPGNLRQLEVAMVAVLPTRAPIEQITAADLPDWW